MVPVNSVSVAATLSMVMWFFRRDIPKDYDVMQLKNPREAILDSATFKAGWWVLALLLVGFFGLEHVGVPISAVASAGALILLGVAARGHVRSEEHTSELQSLMRISYAVFCLKKNNK